MKNLITILTIISVNLSQAQSKYDYIDFNELTEVAGTPYVIASVFNRGKGFDTRARYFLFIDTQNSSSNKVDFPAGAYVTKPKQIHIDSLGINLLLMCGQMHDFDNDGKIGWNDPSQIVALSLDGKQKTQLTENDYFVSTWNVNNRTGVLVVTGYWDTNKTTKYEKTDKSEILLFDLKTLQLKAKI